MYQLPLLFFKCSSDTAICATRIVAMTSMTAYQARQTYKQEKKTGTLLNAAGRLKAKTLIYLDNGTVIASPLSMQRLLTSIDKADAKSTEKRNTRNTNSIKVTMHEKDFEDYSDDELNLDIEEENEDIEEEIDDELYEDIYREYIDELDDYEDDREVDVIEDN